MALKIRRSVHKNTEPEIIYFESDEEFEDWAVAPYATIVEFESGKTWQGDHSDAYKEAIQQGKYFYIKGGLDESKVLRSRRVTKRVSPDFQTTRETVRVELPVENLADSRMIMRSRVLARRQADELLAELLSGNQYDVDPCQIDKALTEAGVTVEKHVLSADIIIETKGGREIVAQGFSREDADEIRDILLSI